MPCIDIRPQVGPPTRGGAGWWRNRLDPAPSPAQRSSSDPTTTWARRRTPPGTGRARRSDRRRRRLTVVPRTAVVAAALGVMLPQCGCRSMRPLSLVVGPGKCCRVGERDPARATREVLPGRRPRRKSRGRWVDAEQDRGHAGGLELAIACDAVCWIVVGSTRTTRSRRRRHRRPRALRRARPPAASVGAGSTYRPNLRSVERTSSPPNWPACRPAGQDELGRVALLLIAAGVDPRRTVRRCTGRVAAPACTQEHPTRRARRRGVGERRPAHTMNGWMSSAFAPSAAATRRWRSRSS
jgi:hypothetical protein